MSSKTKVEIETIGKKFLKIMIDAKLSTTQMVELTERLFETAKDFKKFKDTLKSDCECDECESSNVRVITNKEDLQKVIDELKTKLEKL